MINHSIIPSRGYVYISVTQSPSLEVFLSATRLTIADPEFNAELNRICDFSQANLSHITEQDFKAYVTFAQEHILFAASAKMALVAPDESKRGIFQQFSKQINTGQIRVFTDPDDAVTWIIGAN